MGIYIKIHKILELNQVGYYEVSSDNFGGCYFFIGINKSNKSVECYLTTDFSSPIKIIKFENELIGNLPGISGSILGRVSLKALRVFKMNNFPEFLDYAA